jgi:integrase
MVITMDKAVAMLEQKLADNPMPLDDYMYRQIVDDYLLHYIPKRSGRGVKHTHERIFRYIPEFIRWWADQIRTDALTMEDAHALTERFVEEFAIQKTSSENTQIAVNATLSAFAGDSQGVFLTNPWKRLVVAYDTTLSKPAHVYSADELDAFDDGLGLIARGGAGFTRDQTRQRYKNWFHFLLQTGLRESHAAMFTYRDIFDAVKAVEAGERFRGKKLATTTNFLGDVFYPIPAVGIVMRHKEELGEKISKTKGVSEFVYIHEELYRDILDLYNDARPNLDATLLGISIVGMRKVGDVVKRKMQLENFTWSLRHTWASAYYIMTGGDLKAVATAGGWRSTDIPFRHYIEVMTTRDAYRIVRDYHIYILDKLSDVAREVERTIKFPAAPHLPPTMEGDRITLTTEQLASMIREEVQRALEKG